MELKASKAQSLLCFCSESLSLEEERICCPFFKDLGQIELRDSRK